MPLETKILEAAMRSKEHVFVQYSPHVEGLHVYAHPKDTVYESGAERIYLMSETVYLKWDGACEKLAELLAMIEELG